jgi:hypothetical protein
MTPFQPLIISKCIANEILEVVWEGIINEIITLFFWRAAFGYLYFHYLCVVYVIASIAYIHPVYGAGV